MPLDGGLEEPLPTDWGSGSFSPDGQNFAYNRHPAVWSRKHYRGSYAADLWLCDLDSKTSRKLLDADLPDDQKPNNLWPMFGKDAVYFVSDREMQAKAGSAEVMKSVNNIWKLPLTGEPPVQVTHHTSGSLFWPSISADGRTIVYEENFGLWKLDVSNGHGQPVEVKIDIVADERENNLETKTITSEADAYHLSPSGKRAVVADERRPVHDRHGQGRYSPSDEHAGRAGNLAAVVAGRQMDRVRFRRVRPRGSLVVRRTRRAQEESLGQRFGKGHTRLGPGFQSRSCTRPATRNSTSTRSTATRRMCSPAARSSSSATQPSVRPQWSPDSKWVSYAKANAALLPHVYVIPAAGGKERRITGRDSYSDTNALWTPDGKHIVYLSGMDVGNIGPPNRNNTAQIYSVSLVAEERPAAEKGVDTEAEAANLPAEPERQRGNGTPGAGGRARPVPDVKIDFDHLARRSRQITRSADTISAMTLSPDGKSVAFVTSGVEGGRPVNSIWTATLDGEKTTRVTQSSTPADDEGSPPNPFRFGFGGYSAIAIRERWPNAVLPPGPRHLRSVRRRRRCGGGHTDSDRHRPGRRWSPRSAIRGREFSRWRRGRRRGAAGRIHAQS